jgi:RHS repeat-associated protein
VHTIALLFGVFLAPIANAAGSAGLVGEALAPSATHATALLIAGVTPTLVPPELTGLARDGQVLSVRVPSSQERDATYQWERCSEDGKSCTEILAATYSRYTAGPLDVGMALRAGATLKETDGSDVLVKSVFSQKVAAAAPSRVRPPLVVGQLSVGAELAVSGSALWFGTPPFSLAYQWLRCTGGICLPIVGGAEQTYIPTVLDATAELAVEVIAANATGVATARSKPVALTGALSLPSTDRSAGAESAAVTFRSGSGQQTPDGPATIQACSGNVSNTSPPTVSPSGSIVAGGQISITGNGSWQPNTCGEDGFEFYWLSDGGGLYDAGTSSAPYTTGSGNIGHSISIRVTYWYFQFSNGTYHEGFGYSAGVLVTAPPPPPNGAPYIVEQTAGPNFSVTPNYGPINVQYNDPDNDPGTVYAYAYDDASGTLASTTSLAFDSQIPKNMFLNGMGSPGWKTIVFDAYDSHNLQASNAGFAIHIYSTDPPSTPILMSPLGTVATPSVMTSPTPVLKSWALDSDNPYLAMNFRVTSVQDCPNATGTNIVKDSPLVGTWKTTIPTPQNIATWRVPEGLLKDGQTYYWCSIAMDQQITYGNPNSGWSATRAFTVRVPGFGVRSSWPMWQRGPLAVNEATGNLVVSLPGPSYPTAIGEFGVSATYNSLDLRPNISGLGDRWIIGTVGAVPAKLYDHNLYTGVNGNEVYDGIERVNADGSSDYYAHVAGTNSGAYLSQTGDRSSLSRNADNTWTLADPDGSVYTFAATASTDNSYKLLSAEVAVGKSSDATFLYTHDAQGRIDLIEAKSGGTVVASLDLNWACTGALLCVVGPDGRTWKYIGESGATGRLRTVRLEWAGGGRDLARLGYSGVAPAGVVSSYESANDIADTVAGWRTTHQVSITYNASGKVQDVTDGPIRRDLAAVAGTDLTPKWTFTYTTVIQPPNLPTGTVTAHAGLNPGAVRSAAGFTELCPPRQQPGCTLKARAYYDGLWQTMETRDLATPAAGIVKMQFDVSGQLLWSEDEQSRPTDNTIDQLTGLVTKSELPDADGSGPLNRITTNYRYDETKIGTAIAGPGLQGLQAAYYNNQELTGRPVTLQTDPNVDFGSWTGSPTTGVNADSFSVRWRGILTIPADGDYRFSTIASGGTRLYVDGMQLIDKWGAQSGEICSGEAPLTSGKHIILLEYKDTGSGNANVQLRRTSAGAGCTDGGGADGSVIAASDLAPNYGNRTSTVSPKNTDAGPDLVTFNHFKSPWLGLPDYTLVRDGASQDLVTSFEYDTLGRVVSKVMPKGNQDRPLDGNGDLPTSPIDAIYQTSWTYYGLAETATQDTQCGASSSVTQRGQLRQVSAPGLASTTTVYDAGGRQLSVDTGTRVMCRVYTGDGRLDQEKAKKDTEGALTTTAYTYDPDGNTLSATEGGAPEAITTVYNEAGWVLETEDASAPIGAKARPTYDLEGNVTQRVAQLPSGGASYTSTYVYDSQNRVTSQTDPAGRAYGFWYDSRSFLYAINYANNTFLWRNASDAGLITGLHARHGVVTNAGQEPADASPIVEYSYTNFQNGQRKNENRTGGSSGSPLGTTGFTDYVYDSVGRLETVTFPGSIGSRRYCFDRDSNRTGFTSAAATQCSTPASTYAYSASTADRLDSVTQGPTTAYSYDADGNVTGRGATTFSWDRYGRHNGATLPGANALSDVQFTIDGAPSGSPVTGTSPFQKNVDTTALANGWHTIGATANTTSGKQAAAPTRVIKFQNGASGDSTPPTVSITAPTGGATVNGTVAVNATAADNVGVTAVQFRRDGVDLGSDPSSPYTVNWNTATSPNGSHVLTAVALDAAGNATTSSQITVTVTNGGVSGLVAAYGFEEPSGSSVTDSSGTGNSGTISGATRTASGKNGSALDFDGVDDLVTVPDANSLDLTTGMTLEAWVRPAQFDSSTWRTILFKEAPGWFVWELYAHTGGQSTFPSLFAYPSGIEYTATGTTTLPLNTWSHVSGTFDGGNLRLYVGGTLVATIAAPGSFANTTGPVTMGGNSVWPEWLNGRLDDVRIYNRALSQTEIQADMNTGVGTGGDSTPPTVSITAPTGGATVNGTVAVNATAADNVGVTAVQFRRDGVDLGSDPSSPYTVNWNTATSPNGSHVLTAVALDAAGNATTSSQITVNVGENVPPTAPGTPSVTATPGKAQLTWTGSTDASGIAYYRVHRSTTSGFTPSSGNEIGQTTQASYTDNGDGTTTGLPAATYYYKVIALDVNANVSSASAQGSGVVTADTLLPLAAFTSPTPATVSTVSGTITLATTASSPSGGGSTLSYGFDAVGFRSSRTLNGVTTRYLLGGLIETNSAGAITLFDVDGPIGDLAYYTAVPTAGQTSVSFHYYNAHGDLAVEANLTGTRTAAYTSDPFGLQLEATPADTTTERWTGQWDKKLDTTTQLVEMGVRPYDPALGRFLAVDPVEGGSLNKYDYAGQEPISGYDLDGRLADLPVRGGVYVLEDARGNIRYVGRSYGDVDGRSKRSATIRSTQAGERLTPRTIFNSSNPVTIKGVEQRAMNFYKPDLNKIRGVGRTYWNRAATLRAGRTSGWIGGGRIGGIGGGIYKTL